MSPTSSVPSVRPDTARGFPFDAPPRPSSDASVIDALPAPSPRLALRRAGALSLAASLVLLSACSDGTGGAAGDGDVDDDFLGTNPPAPNPVEPFVGAWELNGPLNGLPEDEAVLVIRPVEANGEARVAIYEFDARDNCYIRSNTSGRVYPDPAFRTDAFLRNVASFDRGVLELSGGNLVIEYFDTFDIDGDGDTSERPTFITPRSGQSETDIEARRCA